MPCHATPRHATPRHATPRHATPPHLTSPHLTSPQQRAREHRQLVKGHEWEDVCGTVDIQLQAGGSHMCQRCLQQCQRRTRVTSTALVRQRCTSCCCSCAAQFTPAAMPTWQEVPALLDAWCRGQISGKSPASMLMSPCCSLLAAASMPPGLTSPQAISVALCITFPLPRSAAASCMRANMPAGREHGWVTSAHYR